MRLCVNIRYSLFSVQPMPEVFVKTSFADKRLPVVVCGVKIKRRSAFVDFSADTTEALPVFSFFVATCYYYVPCLCYIAPFITAVEARFHSVNTSLN